MPKSLFITGITTTTNLGTIGFQGEHDSKQVMLQIMYKVHEDVSILQFSSFPIDLFRARICSEIVSIMKLLYGDPSHTGLFSLYWVYLKRNHNCSSHQR